MQWIVFILLFGNTSQQTALMPVQTTNNSFVTNILYENFEKQVNEIYLNTLALGIFEFSAAQLTTLQTIASYCPFEGGAAVHKARGILSMYQDVNLLDYDCAPNQQAKKGQVSNQFERIDEWNIIVFPNPTNHELTIQSNLVFESNASVEIFNALGQLIATKLIVAETDSIIIDVSSLLDGIYVMRLKNGENVISKTFIVSK